MFKKLRNRFLILNMLITSLVMIVALSTIYLTTHGNIQSDNQQKLRQMSGVQVLTVGGSDQRPVTDERKEQGIVTQMISSDYSLSFNVTVDTEGNILNVGSFIDMPEDVYLTAANMAWENKDGGSTLYLEDKLWLYEVNPAESYMIGKNGVQTIASDSYRISFLDITDSQKTLNDLLWTFLFVGISTLIAIFLVSLFFANRSIRPISQTWEKQRQFVADASHELKTPLSVIMSNYDALLANQDETIRSQKEWLDYMKIGMARMGKLIGDLLSLAKMEDDGGAAPPKAPFDMSVAIRSEVQSMEYTAREKGITVSLSMQPDIIVNSNEELINQVAAILFDNAVKHTDESGEIDVTLVKNKRNIICSVKNTGCGIAKHDLPRIFDRFYRADQSRTANDGGYGLGLPIAKAIMDRLGGGITVYSVEKKWTIFTFSIADA